MLQMIDNIFRIAQYLKSMLPYFFCMSSINSSYAPSAFLSPTKRVSDTCMSVGSHTSTISQHSEDADSSHSHTRSRSKEPNSRNMFRISSASTTNQLNQEVLDTSYCSSGACTPVSSILPTSPQSSNEEYQTHHRKLTLFQRMTRCLMCRTTKIQTIQSIDDIIHNIINKRSFNQNISIDYDGKYGDLKTGAHKIDLHEYDASQYLDLHNRYRVCISHRDYCKLHIIMRNIASIDQLTLTRKMTLQECMDTLLSHVQMT